MGVDRSARMIERARTKLAGRDAAFLVGDAAELPLGERRFDVVLVRHVLWALPDPAAALRHWAGLLTPGGRLVLVEGRWGEADPIGLPAGELTALVEPLAVRTRVESLAHDPALWGKEVADERYVLIADLPVGTPKWSTSIWWCAAATRWCSTGRARGVNPASTRDASATPRLAQVTRLLGEWSKPGTRRDCRFFSGIRAPLCRRFSVMR